MILADAITAPQIQYRALLPILIVLGVATVGVLVEAFVPAAHRRDHPARAQPRRAGRRLRRRRRQPRPGGRRRPGHGRPGQADAVPAGHHPAARVPQLPVHGRAFARRRRRRLRRPGLVRARLGRGAPGAGQPARQQTEIFPLAMFAVAGMLLFPASNNLLHDVRRARGLLAAALPAVRAGPPPPAAVAGSGDEVLPARRVLLRLLPVRARAALRLRALGRPRRRAHRRQPAPSRTRCSTPASP